MDRLLFVCVAYVYDIEWCWAQEIRQLKGVMVIRRPAPFAFWCFNKDSLRGSSCCSFLLFFLLGSGAHAHDSALFERDCRAGVVVCRQMGTLQNPSYYEHHCLMSDDAVIWYLFLFLPGGIVTSHFISPL